MSTKTKILIACIAGVLVIGGGILAVFLLRKPAETTTETSKDKPAATTKTSDAPDIEEDMVFKKETLSMPEYITSMPNYESGPWFDSMYIATSEDGLNFENEKLFLEHSGVPNLIYTSDDKLIAVFQYFSFKNPELFDVIAYTISEDEGTTWSPVRRIEINGLNAEDANVRPSDTPNACDPTLVELEDGSFRLYFTHHPQGEQYPQFYAAKADSIDSIFESEGQQLVTEQMILDPAVVYFEGKWHHYTVLHEGTDLAAEEPPQPGELRKSVHSTSETGTNFTREDDIELEMQFLGDAIEVDGKLRFYGGQDSAISDDGYNWTMDEGTRVEGADPGVVKLPDGSFIIIYTATRK